MRQDMIARWVVWGPAVVALLLGGGCVRHVEPPRIALSQADQDAIHAPRTIIVLPHRLLGAAVVECQRTGLGIPGVQMEADVMLSGLLGTVGLGAAASLAGMSDPPLVAGAMLGGFLGGALGAGLAHGSAKSCTEDRVKGAESAIWPVRDALLGYGPSAALEPDLGQALSALGWMAGNAVMVRPQSEAPPPETAQAIAGEAFDLRSGGAVDAVLVARVEHEMVPSFATMAVSADVTLLRTRRGEAPRVAYHNVLTVYAQAGAVAAAEVPLRQLAEQWAQGDTAQRALDDSLHEIARMIAYDLEQGGKDDRLPAAKTVVVVSHGRHESGRAVYDGVSELPAKNKTVLRSEKGAVVREGDRIWIRTGSGALYSIGDPAAHAQGKLDLRPPTELVQESPPEADSAGGRVLVESLTGGLGAVGGALIGLNIGASGGTLDGAGLGMMGGTAMGAWLGTSLGGGLAGGTGNMGATFLGTAIGSLTSLLAIVVFAPTQSAPLILGSALLFPVTGAIIGYEVSQTPRDAQLHVSSFRFMPTVSISPDGKGASTGLVGTF